MNWHNTECIAVAMRRAMREDKAAPCQYNDDIAFPFLGKRRMSDGTKMS